VTQQINLEKLLDGRRLGIFDCNVILWTFLALFADGYDITVVAFGAPAMVRQWHWDPATLGPLLSASMVGVFFGAPLLGYLGDRWGRKPAIVAGCAIYGLTTLLLVGVTDLGQMTWWRFVAGIGIGGIMPNAVALVAEMAPKRWRAALVVVMFTGAFLGAAAPSLVVTRLMPIYGIKSLFLVGAAIPLVVSILVAIMLPESIRFLALNPRHKSRIMRIARRLRPDVAIAEDAEFVRETPPARAAAGGIAQLFGPGLTFVTPLVWLCFACSLMTMYLLSSWLPLIFERNGILPSDAAWITALYHIGGIAGSLAIGGLLDRFGFLVVAILFTLSVPAIAALGLPGQSIGIIAWISTLSGCLGQSVQLALNAASGVIYPTAFRSKAVGWAFAVGRIGSIAGPMVGGLAFGMHLPFAQLFLIAAIPMLLGAMASAVVTWLLARRSGSFRIAEVLG